MHHFCIQSEFSSHDKTFSTSFLVMNPSYMPIIYGHYMYPSYTHHIFPSYMPIIYAHHKCPYPSSSLVSYPVWTATPVALASSILALLWINYICFNNSKMSLFYMVTKKWMFVICAKLCAKLVVVLSHRIQLLVCLSWVWVLLVWVLLGDLSCNMKVELEENTLDNSSRISFYNKSWRNVIWQHNCILHL